MKKIGFRALAIVGLAMEMACSASAEAPGSTGSTQAAPPRAEEAPPASPQGSSDPMAMPPTPAAGMAMIRAIHASADAPKVDVYVKGTATPVVTGLGYGQTSGWLEVPMGTYELELRAAPSKATDPIAYTTSVTAGDQAMVSLVASGLLASMDASASFRLLPLVERFEPVTGGQVRIRALHAGADAPTVGLDVGNDDPAAPEAAGLARFTDTGQAGVSLPAGSLAIGVALDGKRVTSFTTPALPSGGQLLVIATGLLGKLGRERDGFSLLAIGPNGAVGFIKQDPIVYALHASPDAPAVDAFVGGAEIVGDLSFGELSSPIQVKPGEYELAFYGTTPGSARPNGNAAATASTGQLAAGERYLAEATGLLGGGSFQLLTYREQFDVANDKAVVRAVHASPDAPSVDVGVLTNHAITSVLFPDLGYTKASDEKGLAANPAHLPIGVAAAGSTTPVARFTLPATAGLRAFTVAAGVLTPAAGTESFRLLVVDTAPATWTVTSLYPH